MSIATAVVHSIEPGGKTSALGTMPAVGNDETDTGIVKSGHYSLYPSVGEAFLLAGARSVIGNLWPVTERDAQLLATEFYRAGGPAVGVAALDRARARLREISPNNPASWAGAVWLGAATPTSRRAPSR